MGKLTIFDDDLLTAAQIADALGVYKSSVIRRLKKSSINFTEQRINGGIAMLVSVNDLPDDWKTAVILKYANTEKPVVSDTVKKLVDAAQAEQPEALNFSVDWAHFERKSGKQKAGAYKKTEILREFKLLEDLSQRRKSVEHLKLVAERHGMSWRTLQNWWHGKPGKPGVKHFDTTEWPAVLINCYSGKRVSNQFSQEAFDFCSSLYLDRRKPSLAECYRRTNEISDSHDWVMPSEKTMERYIEREISLITRVLYRDGEVAMRKLFPFQHRDKTCFKAGEAVSGDGLKFDQVYVEFEDGEILNTTTGWFWQDIYSGKILAYRLDKTENTDVFRLATYDLTALCTPYYVQVDNTRVAANKAMTGQAKGRKRFKDLPTDPMGILLHLGMDVHFTDPDHRISNPGVKPIERGFGIGGIHSKVATNPALRERGFSRKTAIPFDEFRQIVAEEVVRHNAQEKRRSDVCRGIYSFDEAFARNFATAKPRKTSEEQRRLLLMMPEQVRTHSQNGMITINAGKGPTAKNRYYTEELIEFAGQELVVFYDPQNLHTKVHVYSMDNRYLFDAEWQPSVAFNDQAAAREYAKNIARRRKAAKKVAAAEKRMSDLELLQYFPEKEAAAMPDATVVTGVFEKTLDVPGSIEIDQDTGEILNAEDLFGKTAERLDAALQQKLADEI